MQLQVTAHRTRLCLLIAAMALGVMPASAAAEAYVPPGNSAATQYTEAVPTAGGPKATSHPKGGKSRTPDRVLGTHKTAKLDAQGAQGRAAAEVAALTAPSTVGAKTEANAAPGHGTAAHKDTQTGSGGVQPGSGSGSGDLSQSASSGHPPQAVSGGSSAVGEVADQATGSSSSGQLGVWLPLLIAAVVIWSGAYVLRRQRRRPAG
jgi:hypothetical protein